MNAVQSQVGILMKRNVVLGVVLSVLMVAGYGRAASQDSTKATAPPASPAVTYEDGSLRLSKDAYVRVGGLLQPAVELQQDLPTAAQSASSAYTRRWQHQLFVRRMRFLFGGKVTQDFAFFFDFEAANVGRITNGVKAMTPTVNLLDAQLSYIASQQFSVMSGLMIIGPSRNGLQSATSLMPVGYGCYTFIANSGSPNGLDSYVARDIAVMARGLLVDNRFEYRVSVSDGRSRALSQSLYSPVRITTRVQYDFLDKQVADLTSGIGSYFYTGTYFGKKSVFAVGGGIDIQGAYTSLAADLFLDRPMGDGDGLTVSLGYQYLNGGSPDNSDLVLRTSTGTMDSVRADAIARLVPKESVVFAEAGYYLKNLSLQPVVKMDIRHVNATSVAQLNLPANASSAQIAQAQDKLSESRVGVGLNYVPRGHNFNLKAMWEYVSRTQDGIATAADRYPEFNKGYSLFTLQGQWMFF